MRQTFTDSLLAIAKKNSRVMLVTGDLGFSVFEPFERAYPDQYLNMGVTEQSMTGFAAGLAIEGFIPIIYSISPFITVRNLEQIRNDICYQHVNVKIVTVGAGFSYGAYGHTHHGLEDMGILRTIPNMTIVAPGDPVEVRLATRWMIRHKGPVYMRLGKSGDPIVHTKSPQFAIGKAIDVKKGRDGVLFTTSTLLKTALDVAVALEPTNSLEVVSMPFIKPIDIARITRAIRQKKFICTLEEHSVIGGLGTAVAEIIARSGQGVPFLPIGVPDRITKVIGLTQLMRQANGLTVKQLVVTIQQALKRPMKKG